MLAARSIRDAVLSPKLCWLLCAAVAAAMIVKVLWNGTQIFDLHFADGTVYMGQGLNGPSFSSYEHSGLYALYYRALSWVIHDPVALYLWGGVVLLAICVFAIFLSIGTIARSPLTGLFAATLFAFSDVVTVRISHAAIVVLCVGMAAFVLVRSFVAKSAVLLLCTFLVAFIRPEFVLSFNILLAITGVVVVWEIVRAVRGRRMSDLVRPAIIPAWVALLALSVLIAAWSFPIVQPGGRMMAAFGQHFALRHVETNKLAINPWWNYREIIAPIFPGATSWTDALRIAPGVMARFMLTNAADLGDRLRKDVKLALIASPPGGRVAYFTGWALITFGALTMLARRTPERGSPESSRRNAWITVGGAFALMVSPLISTIVVYPRRHYAITILYLLLVCGAVLVALMRRSHLSALAVAAVALGLLIVTPVLPKVDQPELRVVQAARAIPGITDLYEADLGWCIYYRPTCQAYTPWRPREAAPFEELVRTGRVNAVMISPGLRAVEWIANDPFFKELETNPGRFGFEKIELPSWRVLLLKRP